LDLPVGTPTHNVFSMARRGLRLELRATLHQAVSSGQVAIRSNVRIEANGGRQMLEIVAHPLHQQDRQGTLFMIVFKDVGVITPMPKSTARKRKQELENSTAAQLEAELKATRERLQITTEELESSNEELKSSNEELSSINEELQSAN